MSKAGYRYSCLSLSCYFCPSPSPHPLSELNAAFCAVQASSRNQASAIVWLFWEAADAFHTRKHVCFLCQNVHCNNLVKLFVFARCGNQIVHKFWQSSAEETSPCLSLNQVYPYCQAKATCWVC